MKFKRPIPEGFAADYPHMGNFEMAVKYFMPVSRVQYLGGCLGLKKTKEAKSRVSGKITFTKDELQYIRDHYEYTTNADMARHLGRKQTLVRTNMYAMGLYRQELEYWTEEQAAYLRENFRTMGDTEIAEYFDEKYAKEKGWTKKHIEKKRRQLRLKRTKAEIKAIHQRNVDMGKFSQCAIKRWEKTGQAAEGTIRYWNANNSKKTFPVIKVGGKWIHYARYRWEQLHGPLPKGFNIVFLDGNQYNLDDNNLGKLTNAELSRFNAEKMSIGLGDNYVLGIMTIKSPGLRETIRNEYPELIELKRKQLLLNRTINESLRTGSETE